MKLPTPTAIFLLASALFIGPAAPAQIPFNPLAKPSANPLTDPTLSPGTAFLFNLEAKFAA